jgi:hypothetical protein
MTDALIEAVEKLASDTRYGLRTLENTVAALVPDRSKNSDEYELLDAIDDRIKDDLVPPLDALHKAVDANLPRIDRGVTEIFGELEDIHEDVRIQNTLIGDLKVEQQKTNALLERIAKAQEAIAVALCVRGGP